MHPTLTACVAWRYLQLLTGMDSYVLDHSWAAACFQMKCKCLGYRDFRRLKHDRDERHDWPCLKPPAYENRDLQAHVDTTLESP